jgi:phosphohistidine phosphatase
MTGLTLMILYFLRHASAGEKKANGEDDQRALDEDGMQQCALIGQALRALNVEVDEVVASPLKRASQTAERVAREMGHTGKVRLAPALRPNAGYEQFLSLLEDFSSDDTVLLVGHKAKLVEFLGSLINRPGARVNVQLKKGALAKVEWRKTTGWLHWCVTPKLLLAYLSASGHSRKERRSAALTTR